MRQTGSWLLGLFGQEACESALWLSLALCILFSSCLLLSTLIHTQIKNPSTTSPNHLAFFLPSPRFPQAPPPPFSLFLSLIRPPPKYLEHKSHSTCLCPPFSLLPFLRFLTLSSLCSQAPPFGPRCTTLGSSLLLSLPVSSQLIERGMLCSLSKEGVQAKEKKGGGEKCWHLIG